MFESVTPYPSEASKKQQIAHMFDRISPRYDFLNHLMSAGIDIGWRKNLIEHLLKNRPNRILDVATGTADLAIMAAKKSHAQLTGLDLSAGMLARGQKKIKVRKLQHRIRLIQGDAENMPFCDEQFDALSIAFGVRNFENLQAGLQQMSRVTRSGGQNFILEFSKPKGFPIAQLYHFYFHHIMPAIGRYASKDSRAYRYLTRSVAAFPDGEAMRSIISSCGFSACELKPFHFGIATLYIATK